MILSNDSDTILWKRVTDKNYKLISEKKIEERTGNFFRFSSQNFIAEIACEKEKCTGKVTFFSEPLEDENGKRPNKNVFKKEYALTQKQVTEIKSLISSSEIEKIPSDKFIKDWQYGNDGIAYVFETKTENLWTYKHYWSPGSHFNKELDQAKKVEDFAQLFLKIVEYNKLFEDYLSAVPQGYQKFYL